MLILSESRDRGSETDLGTVTAAVTCPPGIASFAPGLVSVAAAGSTYSRIDAEGVTHLTDALTA